MTTAQAQEMRTMDCQWAGIVAKACLTVGQTGNAGVAAAEVMIAPIIRCDCWRGQQSAADIVAGAPDRMRMNSPRKTVLFWVSLQSIGRHGGRPLAHKRKAVAQLGNQ